MNRLTTFDFDGHDTRRGMVRRRYVYFATAGPYLKVGFSIDPQRRVRTFRSGGLWIPTDLDPAEPLALIHTVPGGPRREAEAHIALIDFHVNGEWFLNEPESIAAVLTFGEDEFPYVPRPSGSFRIDLHEPSDITQLTPAGSETPRSDPAA